MSAPSIPHKAKCKRCGKCCYYQKKTTSGLNALILKKLVRDIGVEYIKNVLESALPPEFTALKNQSITFQVAPITQNLKTPTHILNKVQKYGTKKSKDKNGLS